MIIQIDTCAMQTVLHKVPDRCTECPFSVVDHGREVQTGMPQIKTRCMLIKRTMPAVYDAKKFPDCPIQRVEVV